MGRGGSTKTPKSDCVINMDGKRHSTPPRLAELQRKNFPHPLFLQQKTALFVATSFPKGGHKKNRKK